MSEPISVAIPMSELELLFVNAVTIANPRVPFYPGDRERGLEECIAEMQGCARDILAILRANNASPVPSPGFPAPKPIQ